MRLPSLRPFIFAQSRRLTHIPRSCSVLPPPSGSSSFTTTSKMGDKPVTAYPNYEPKQQQQTLPGSERSLEPNAEPTKLERWDEEGKPYLAEYVGSGKLKNKKIIITGGDSGIGKSVASEAESEHTDRDAYREGMLILNRCTRSLCCTRGRRLDYLVPPGGAGGVSCLRLERASVRTSPD